MNCEITVTDMPDDFAKELLELVESGDAITFTVANGSFVRGAHRPETPSRSDVTFRAKLLQNQAPEASNDPQ